MIRKMEVPINRAGFLMDGEVNYRQPPYWFGQTTRDLKMDVIYPREPLDKPWPCLVWISGGAWLQMDHHAFLPNFIDLARKGFVIASVQYRLSNEVEFPGPLQDIKAAVRYLRKNAERYQIYTESFGVMGESAGGHLAGLMAATNGLKQFDQGDFLEFSSSVQAACPWYMVSDLTAFPQTGIHGLSPEARLLGTTPDADPEKAKAASPISYVTKDCAPCLLFHGTADTLVPHDQSVRFHDALDQAGVPVELYSIPGADHSDRHFFQKPVAEKMADFFTRYLK